MPRDAYGRVTGASGTAAGRAPGSPRQGLSSRVVGHPPLLPLAAGNRPRPRLGGPGRETGHDHRARRRGPGRRAAGAGPQLILAHRNDLVAELSARLDRAGCNPHAAVRRAVVPGPGHQPGGTAFKDVIDTAGQPGAVLVINMQGARGVDIAPTAEGQGAGRAAGPRLPPGRACPATSTSRPRTAPPGPVTPAPSPITSPPTTTSWPCPPARTSTSPSSSTPPPAKPSPAPPTASPPTASPAAAWLPDGLRPGPRARSPGPRTPCAAWSLPSRPPPPPASASTFPLTSPMHLPPPPLPRLAGPAASASARPPPQPPPAAVRPGPGRRAVTTTASPAALLARLTGRPVIAATFTTPTPPPSLPPMSATTPSAGPSWTTTTLATRWHGRSRTRRCSGRSVRPRGWRPGPVSWAADRARARR